MKQSHAASVTSLPQSPQDEATGRVRRYWITMGIRMACFALALLVTPYGWYTWAFAIGAAVLPYIAVVFANAISPTASAPPQSPVQELTTSAPDAPSATTDPTVLTIREHEAVTELAADEEKPGDDAQ